MGGIETRAHRGSAVHAPNPSGTVYVRVLRHETVQKDDITTTSIAGPLAGGLIADRLGRARTLIATHVGAAIAVAAFGHAGSSLAVLAASLVWP